MEILIDVVAELENAQTKFPPFNSAHEGYAILLEQVDELWEAVRLQYGASRDDAIRHEAVQVAAMALRFLIDVCEKEAK